jgi:hypothetical protein
MDTIATALRTGVPPKGTDQTKFYDSLRQMPPRRLKEDAVSMAEHLAAFCKASAPS